MFYVYLVASVALIPLLNNFFEILRQPYSLWLVPLLLIGFFLGFIILHIGLFALSIALININSPADRFHKPFRAFVNITLPLLFKLARVKINASGTEKLPQNTRLLIVSNHQHDFDPVVMMSVFPEADVGFIGKKEIYQTMPFIGKAMHKLYCLPIDRENNREAAKTIIEAIKILKEDKASIGLFPEGYVSKSCELLPLRSGSLKIAYKAEVPIVVCVINNTRAIAKNFLRRRTDIEFRVLSVIYPEQFKSMTTVELGNVISAQMQESLKEIRK